MPAKAVARSVALPPDEAIRRHADVVEVDRRLPLRDLQLRRQRSVADAGGVGVDEEQRERPPAGGLLDPGAAATSTHCDASNPET